MGQLVFQATAGGQVALVGPNPSTSFALNVPAVNGNLVTTGDTGTVTNTMLASNVYTAPGTIGSVTPNTGAFTNLSYTGTLTGGTGVVNLGSGQFYIDTSGNVGIGTSSPTRKLEVYGGASGTRTDIYASNAGGNFNCGVLTDNNGFISTSNASLFYTNSAERMRIDSSGNLLVGTTSGNAKLRVLSDTGRSQGIYVTHPNSGNDVISCENSATTGNNNLIVFYTDATVSRGSINYNRTAGLIAYNTTSDYRAKDITSLLSGSGEIIDSVPVYMGKMKGATQARPMFIAHETPDYAHTGEKDAVDKDGKPIYQQMDASSLVPVLWAEVQSLRKRVAQLESK